MVINNQMPAPTLRFKKGQMAAIEVVNKSDEATTLHWHGILLPTDMDGPAFTNNKVIRPGKSFTFYFPIKQTGTYWYHSHTALQEQRGLYGAIVIEDEVATYKDVKYDKVAVLSDWSDEHPMKILANLKKDGDYYAFKKQFFPSLVAAIRHGNFWNYFKRSWQSMGPMDLSDVAYDAFLMNGKTKEEMNFVKPGDKIRLRVINAAASSYFYINLGNLRKFKVIAKDGEKIKPIEVTEILIGIGETYDIIFTTPKGMSGGGMGHGQHQGHTNMPMRKKRANAIEFRATSQDVTGYSSLILGHDDPNNEMDNYESVPDHIRPNPFDKMSMGDMDMDNMDNMDHAKKATMNGTPNMKMSNRLKLSQIESLKNTAYASKYPRVDELKLVLGGDMGRYNWTINGKRFSQKKYLIVKENHVIRYTFVNQTMMHHPMHLHGHYFRVLNGKKGKSPLFHTLDVAPMQTVTIEFLADNPGIWFFHCHNLYHMKMGMTRLVKYEKYNRPDYLIQDEKMYEGIYKTDSSLFPRANVGLYTNNLDIDIGINGGNWDISINLEMLEYDPDNLEIEFFIRRYMNQYFNLVVGAEYSGGEIAGLLGVGTTLPFNIDVTTYIKTNGQVVAIFEQSIPLYHKLNLELEPKVTYDFIDNEVNLELQSRLNYQLTKKLSTEVYHKYEMGEGNSVGFGAVLSW